jgi:LysM repeat protein
MVSIQSKVLSGFFLFFLMLVSVLQPVNAADWQYTMRPGDTLWSVCKEYTKEPGCWQKLGPLNNIGRDRAIPPGTRIRIPANWLKVPAATATIVFVQGDVSFQRPDEMETPASEGVELTIGSKLITGNGSVSLSFADGSSMVLEPNSQLELDTLSNFELNGMVDSTVRLNRGTVKTRVIKREPRSHFRTITPSALAAVRGTEYRVNVVSSEQQKQSTLVEVYEGLVDVGADKVTFPVPATFGIVAKQGETLQEPVKLLDKPELIGFEEQQIILIDDTRKRLSSPSIQWQEEPLAAGYQLNILADQQGKAKTEKLITSYRTEANTVTIKDLAQGCYQLSLRAIDKLGLHGLAAQKRLCLTQQIALPPEVEEETSLWPMLIPIGLFILAIL